MDSTAQSTMDLCVEMVERRRQDNPRPPLKSSERLLNALQLVQSDFCRLCSRLVSRNGTRFSGREYESCYSSVSAR